MLRDLLRSRSGRQKVTEFVRGERGIRSLVNSTSSQRTRSELYRLEREGVDVARARVKAALRSVGSR